MFFPAELLLDSNSFSQYCFLATGNNIPMLHGWLVCFPRPAPFYRQFDFQLLEKGLVCALCWFIQGVGGTVIGNVILKNFLKASCRLAPLGPGKNF